MSSVVSLICQLEGELKYYQRESMGVGIRSDILDLIQRHFLSFLQEEALV